MIVILGEKQKQARRARELDNISSFSRARRRMDAPIELVAGGTIYHFGNTYGRALAQVNLRQPSRIIGFHRAPVMHHHFMASFTCVCVCVCSQVVAVSIVFNWIA